MSAPEDIWTTRLHTAVDDHPGALAFDVPSYVLAGRKRVRRNRAAGAFATVAAVAVVAAVVAVAGVGTRGAAPEPAGPDIPILGPGTNGWVAVAAYQDGSDIYLARPGEDARRLEVAGSDAANDACPVWSPDGTRLMFGRVKGPSDATSHRDAELVIVPIDQSGTAGTPMEIGLDGFEVLDDGSDGFEGQPCGTWAPDGRWVALRGPGEVWVVDTQTGAVRRLPDLRPSDLEWRPGTDQLAIAGDMGTTLAEQERRYLSIALEVSSTPVTVYSVSTGELRQLGSIEAAHLTWSPDGSTLAYTGGESDPNELWLVDANGANERLLVADSGVAVHGIGPVWSPTGDHIAYQRRCCGHAETHEVVLVRIADGNQTVIEPPQTDGPNGPARWYPWSVTWSPDGTTLLYTAWTDGGDGVIAVSADTPSDVTVLADAIGYLVPGYKDHQWVPIQMWGRQPG